MRVFWYNDCLCQRDRCTLPDWLHPRTVRLWMWILSFTSEEKGMVHLKCSHRSKGSSLNLRRWLLFPIVVDLKVQGMVVWSRPQMKLHWTPPGPESLWHFPVIHSAPRGPLSFEWWPSTDKRSVPWGWRSKWCHWDNWHRLQSDTRMEPFCPLGWSRARNISSWSGRSRLEYHSNRPRESRRLGSPKSL